MYSLLKNIGRFSYAQKDTENGHKKQAFIERRLNINRKWLYDFSRLLHQQQLHKQLRAIKVNHSHFQHWQIMPVETANAIKLQ